MLYDEAQVALTKERLEDLRKEKRLSFEQLSKQLAERGVSISHCPVDVWWHRKEIHTARSERAH